MPNVITEAATWDEPISVPADGDDEDAASVTDPLVGFQGLTNRSLYLVKNAAYQQIGDSFLATTSTTDLLIGTRQIILTDGTTARWMQIGGAFTPTIAGNQWRYIYAYATAAFAGISYESSTTAPVSSNGYVYKSGDPTRAYLGCIRTNGTPEILPFVMRRGRYVYRGSAANLVVSAGNSTVFAAATSPGIYIPPHAATAMLIAEHTAAASGFTQHCDTRYPGDASGAIHSFHTVSAGINSMQYEQQVGASGQFDYLINDGAGSVTIAVAGFVE